MNAIMSFRVKPVQQSRLDFKGCKVDTTFVATGNEWHDKLETHTVLVNPELAAAWLEMNPDKNRPEVAGNTRKLVADAKEGRWVHTHQGICFAVLPNGEIVLVDGQHRLHMCIESGISIVLEVSVFRGISVRSPIDTNARRRADFINGLGTRKHPVTRVLMGLQRGNLSFMAAGPSAVGECYEENKEALDTVIDTADVNAANRQKLIRCPALGAISFAYPVNPAVCKTFAEKLASGENITRSEPVYTLRAWLAPGLTEKEIAYGTLAALKAAFEGRNLLKIHTGPSPYEWFCSRRRGMGVPNTPRFEK